jgi:hypothetical protein
MVSVLPSSGTGGNCPGRIVTKRLTTLRQLDRPNRGRKEKANGKKKQPLIEHHNPPSDNLGKSIQTYLTRTPVKYMSSANEKDPATDIPSCLNLNLIKSARLQNSENGHDLHRLRISTMG